MHYSCHVKAGTVNSSLCWKRGRASSSFDHRMGTVEDGAGAHFLQAFWLLDLCVCLKEKKVSAHFLYLNIKNYSNRKCHAFACDTQLEIRPLRRAKIRAALKHNLSLKDDM